MGAHEPQLAIGAFGFASCATNYPRSKGVDSVHPFSSGARAAGRMRVIPEQKCKHWCGEPVSAVRRSKQRTAVGIPERSHPFPILPPYCLCVYSRYYGVSLRARREDRLFPAGTDAEKNPPRPNESRRCAPERGKNLSHGSAPLRLSAGPYGRARASQRSPGTGYGMPYVVLFPCPFGGRGGGTAAIPCEEKTASSHGGHPRAACQT
jgi:hypothetical protein